MNPIIRILILLFVDFLIFKYIGVIFGVIGLLIIIFRVLKMFGFFRNPSFFKGSFCEGIAFLKDYQGPYYKNRKAFEDALNLIKTFKLNEPKDGKEKYVIIGIYYDICQRAQLFLLYLKHPEFRQSNPHNQNHIRNLHYICIFLICQHPTNV